MKKPRKDHWDEIETEDGTRRMIQRCIAAVIIVSFPVFLALWLSALLGL